MTRLTRRLVFTVTSLLALLALPGTAYAMPAPILPDRAGAVPAPVIVEQMTSTSSVTVWQIALIALAAALVAALAVVVLTRLTSGSRRTHLQPA